MPVRDNKTLGAVKTPGLDRNAKATYLEHYCKKNGVSPIDAATIGDKANNLAMLQSTGMGVGLRGQVVAVSQSGNPTSSY